MVRAGILDAELAALLWLLVQARTPVVAVGESSTACDVLIDGLIAQLPDDGRRVAIAPDDDFEWLPEAAQLGWRRERSAARSPEHDVSSEHTQRADHASPISPADAVLVVHGLGTGSGVDGPRARIVVRSLALGYGLLATMRGGSLEDALNTLHASAIGTDPDERSRLGVVLVVAGSEDTARIVAAHYVRPVALDTHGHVQRLPPAVLATWNDPAGRYDHFAWGVAADLAGRVGFAPVELEAEVARRSNVIADLAAGSG